jgi:hypothetical protein
VTLDSLALAAVVHVVHAAERVVDHALNVVEGVVVENRHVVLEWGVEWWKVVQVE